jgi:gluconokinase
MNVIGLEVSTSAAKCILFSLEEGIIDVATVPYSKDVSDVVSQDPEGIFQAALDAIGAIVQRTDKDIAAIGLGGTWHSLLLLDRMRKPLGRIRTWADFASASSIAALKEDSVFKDWFYHKTGCMVHALYPVWKFYHLRKTEPELARRVESISSQIEYVFEHLTGVQALSKCTASGTGLFNIHTLDWDEDILDFAGVKKDCLGELREAPDTARLLSSIVELIGLPAGIPVTVGSADGALNHVGIGGSRFGIMSFSVGTSAAIRLVHDEPKLPPNPSTWCYYLYNQKRLEGAATHACNNLDWYIEHLMCANGHSPDYVRYDREAAAVSFQDAPYFLPFLFGERCPGWEENRKGGFVGVTARHTDIDLYFAVLEGILFNLYHCYLILSEAGGAPEEIRISGGIMNSPFWLQMAADIFGKELCATGFANDSTVGAALFALQAVGGISQIEDYQPNITSRIVPQDDKIEVFRTRFEKYLEYYERSL